MQIPLVNPQQRIDPSSPVAVGSPEGVAGNKFGAAQEAMGNALYNFGNLLDAAGKRAKDEEDKLNVQIAVNKAKFQMLDARAQQEAADIKQGDRADGFSGAERFKQAVDETNGKIALELGDPKLQRMFYANIGDDVAQSSQLVWADEVKKREEIVKIKMQDDINGKSAVLRKEFAFGNVQNAGTVMAQLEQSIMANDLLAPADKPKAIADAKKQAAKESLAGLMDRGNKGDTSSFNKAKSVLVSQYAKIFTSDEMDKEMGNIDQAENTFYQREYQKDMRAERLANIAFKKTEEKTVTEYNTALKTAGNNQFAMDAVMERVAIDPRLSNDVRKRVLENRVFTEVQDDKFEGTFMTNLVKTKDYAGSLDKLTYEYAAGHVSADRRDKLIKAMQNMADYKKNDPTIMNHVNTVEKQILGLGKKSMVLDPMTGLYQAEYDKVTNARLAKFTGLVANYASRGPLTVAIINGARDQAISGSGEEDMVRVPPAGVTATDVTKPDASIDAIVGDFTANGHSWSKDVYKKKIEQYKFFMQKKVKDENDNQIKIMRNIDIKKDPGTYGE